jgi:type IV secretion system protein VirB3
LLGGERTLVLLAGLFSMVIGVSGLSFISFIGALCFWFSCMWVLVRMGKADPLLFDVYRRYLNYKLYYSAQGGGHCKIISSLWRRR